MVYFIYDPVSDCVKIGYTENSPESRLSSLQTGNPNRLILLAVTEGDKTDEANIHKELEYFRADGGSEWFMLNSRSYEFILDWIEKKREVRSNFLLYAIPANECFIPENRVRLTFGREIREWDLHKYFLIGSGRGVHARYYYKQSEVKKMMEKVMEIKKRPAKTIEISVNEYAYLVSQTRKRECEQLEKMCSFA